MQVPRLLAAALLAAATLVAGCTSGGDGPPALSVGILRPAHLLPASVVDPDGAQVLAALFSPLVRIDADGRPVPVAAQAVTSADNRVWTVRLRPGWTFHDGEPVTAEHYVTAWSHAAHGANRQARSYLFSNIAGYAALQPRDPDGDGPAPAAAPPPGALAGLRAVDRHTFTVTLLQPFVDFPAMLASPAFYPLPSSAWHPAGVLRPDFARTPVGNGPFRLDGPGDDGDRILLRRYDGFAGPKPKLAAVEFRIYPRLGPAFVDVVDGDLDVVTAIPTEHAGTAEARLGGRLLSAPGAVVQLLAFPVVEHDFVDARVRRAVSMAIDRDALLAAVPGAAQEPARAFVAPVVPGYRAQGCGTACRFDPTAARQLYAAAGGPDRLQIAYNRDGGHRQWVEALCAQLARNLAVPCTGVAEPTFGGLLAAVQRHALTGPFRMSWEMDYPSMESYLGPLYGSTGAANYSGYRNPEFDDLLRQATAGRPADAVRLYQQAENLLAADMPAVPLRFSRIQLGFAAGVRDLAVDRAGRIDLSTVEKQEP